MYPTKKLWEICDLYQPKTISIKDMIEDWKYPVFWANWIIWKYNQYNHENEEILITCRWATCWTINISEKFSWINWNAMVSHIKDKEKLNFYFLYYFFKNTDFSKIISGSAQPQITRQWLVAIPIPLPPLPTQQKIVSKLDSLFEKLDQAITLTKQNLANIEELNKSILKKSYKYPKVFISDIVASLFAWWDLPKNWNYSKGKTNNFTIPIYANAVSLDWLYGYTDFAKVTEPAITISARWTIGFTKLRSEPFYPIVRLLVLIPKKNLANLKYLEYILNTVDMNQFWSSIPQLSVPQLKNFQIPLPPLPEQQKIVEYLDNIFAKNKILQEKYKQDLQNLEELKQSILKQAFEDEDFIK